MSGPYVEDRFHFASDDFGDNFIYHYTSAAAAHKIIYTKALRFGSLANCNDPRENKDPIFMRWFESTDPDIAVDAAAWELFEAEFEKGLLRNKYLSCFTVDEIEPGIDGYWKRGFGRARNWAQYGDNHRGVCLIFHRETFVSSVNQWVEAHGKSHLGRCTPSARMGRIDYADTPYMAGVENSPGLNSSLRSVLDGPAASVSLIWNDETQYRRLFFEKALDWASEREYRVVISCDCTTNPLVAIEGSLIGVTLGADYGDEDRDILRTRVREAGLLPFAAAQMRWLAGAPHCAMLDGWQVIPTGLMHQGWID